MQALPFFEVRRRMCQLSPSNLPGSRWMVKAAVAVIFRPAPSTGESELLFIRRAEHPQDPWSGHMAFPGGRVEPDDPDVQATAIRETHEEIGLDLNRWATPFGRLSQVLTKAQGRLAPMAVVPFLFELKEEPLFSLNNEEVTETLWIPLAFFLDKANRSTMSYSFQGLPLKLPCYRYEGRVIWGLTLRMIDEMQRWLRAAS